MSSASATGPYRAYTRVPDGSIALSFSRDGLGWTFIGMAFRDTDYPNASDPDVFETGTGWVMLLSIGPQLLRATSADGLSFTTSGVASLGGIGSSTVKSRYRVAHLLSFQPESPNRAGGHPVGDDVEWRIVAHRSRRSTGDSGVGPAQYGVTKPAPVRRADGSWAMLVTTFIEEPGRY
jgi:hypothetical protein